LPAPLFSVAGCVASTKALSVIHTSPVEHSSVLQPWPVPCTGWGFSLTLTRDPGLAPMTAEQRRNLLEIMEDRTAAAGGGRIIGIPGRLQSVQVSLPMPLIAGAWPNHRDHAHLRWIDEHDPIVHLGELVGLGFGVGGEDVVRRRVRIDDRRYVRPDVGDLGLLSRPTHLDTRLLTGKRGPIQFFGKQPRTK
jgi:hypothetical protein